MSKPAERVWTVRPFTKRHKWHCGACLKSPTRVVFEGVDCSGGPRTFLRYYRCGLCSLTLASRYGLHKQLDELMKTR